MRPSTSFYTSTALTQPTITIRADCTCTWVVVKAGPGLECVSAMKQRNALCPVRHERKGE